MREQRIPQGGLRRPKPKKAYPVTMGTATTKRIDRRQDGTYRCWEYREDRYCNPMQVGSAAICVMDDFGSLVVVRREDASWY